jgi:hypothetical protein
MVLPGKMAKEYRQGFAKVLCRYHAGDLTLITEIHANAASNTQFQRLAHKAVSTPVPSGGPNHCEGNTKKDDAPPMALDDDNAVVKLTTEKRSKAPLATTQKRRKLMWIDDEDDTAERSNAETAIVPFSSEFDVLSARWEAEDQEAIASAAGGRVFGFCYIAWNPCFRKLYKLGATTRQPIHRIQELSRTSVPEPFQLVAAFPCWQPFQVEKRIHAQFAASRKYGRRNEFFEALRTELLAFFSALSVEAITASAHDPAHTTTYTATPRKNVLRSEIRAIRAEMSAQTALLQGLHAAQKQ